MKKTKPICIQFLSRVDSKVEEVFEMPNAC